MMNLEAVLAIRRSAGKNGFLATRLSRPISYRNERNMDRSDMPMTF